MQLHPFLMKLSAFLFGTFLSLAVLAYALAGFTAHDVAQPAFTKTISGQLQGQIDSNQLKQALLLQCTTKSSVDAPLQSEKISLSCADLSKPGADINVMVAKALFDKSYYKKYDCGFVTCVRQELAKGVSPNIVFLFVSGKAHNFYSWVVILLIALTAGFGLIMLELEQTWVERLKSLGWAFVWTGSSLVLILFKGKTTTSFLDPVTNLVTPIYAVLLAAGIACLAGAYWLRRKEKTI